MSTEKTRKPRKSSASKSSTPAKKPRAQKKPAKKPRAQKKPAKKPAGRPLPPSTPIIPFDDPLVGKQFSANVNCRPVVSRKGKTRQKCDRQRLAVVGGASPSADHPKRKQVFAVQAGQRFTIPDRELRRDLRESEKVRQRYAGEVATCDTYLEQLVSGASVPREAYEQCPTLPDALEPPPGAVIDTSFDVKGNARRKFNGAVPGRGRFDVSKAFDKTAWTPFVVQVMEANQFRTVDFQPFNDGPSAEAFAQNSLRSMPHGARAFVFARVDAFGRPIKKFVVSPLVAVHRRTPNGIERETRATLNHHGGYNEVPQADHPDNAHIRALLTDAISPPRKANHHHGHHEPGDPLGVYLPALDQWARGRRRTWTHRILGWVFYVQPGVHGFDAGVTVDQASNRYYRFPTPSVPSGTNLLFRVVEGAPTAEAARDGLAEWYGYVNPRAKENGAGASSPYGVHSSTLDLVRDYLAQWALRPELRELPDGRVTLTPTERDLRNEKDVHYYHAALDYKRAGNALLRTQGLDPSGEHLIVAAEPLPARVLAEMQERRAHDTRALDRMSRRDRRKSNPPAGLAPGQTYQDGRADPLRGRRVSGDRYAGEIRNRAVGCDGKTPAHITGGFVLPRSRAAAGVRRDERLAAERASRPRTVVNTRPILGLPAPRPSFDGVSQMPRRFGPGGVIPVRATPARPVASTFIEPTTIIDAEVVAPEPIAMMTNADHLAEVLGPGTVFTVLTDGSMGFPASQALKVTGKAVRGPKGELVIGVKEAPRGRKPMQFTMRPDRPYWVWMGEVKLERPRLMAMFDDALMPAMGVTAPYAPVMMGRINEPYVVIDERVWAAVQAATPVYDLDATTGRPRAAGGAPAPSPRPVPRPVAPAPRQLEAGPSSPRPVAPAPRRDLGAGSADPVRPRPVAAPSGEMSDEELAAEFERLMLGGNKSNGARFGRRPVPARRW